MRVKMKITKRQLRRIIQETISAEEEFENAGIRGREMAKTKHQFDRAFRQMRAFEAPPSDIADMEEIRDLYYQDLPKGEASIYLKRLVSGVDTIIREQIPQDVYYWIFPDLLDESYSVNEGVLYVTHGPYGMSVSANDPDPYDGDGEPIMVGEIVKELIDSGDTDFFQAPQGVDEEALNRIIAKDKEGVQGGMTRWDPDVFSDYYNVDDERLIRLYARLKNHQLREIPYRDY
tara:strand:- start:1304 stop:1999 length:696 start_codon:yes stop_codon:yes gene_type:complete